VLLINAILLSSAAAAVDDLGTWCELTTERFHLVSDLDEGAQRDLLTMLERFPEIAELYLPGKPVTQSGPLKVIVFTKRSDFRQLTGKRKFAAFMQPSLQTNRLLIGPVRGSVLETALHEYAHYLLRNRLDVSLPIWFDEGLASLLGTTRITEDMAEIGQLPLERMRTRTQIPTGITSNRMVDGDSPQRSLNGALEATSIEDWPQRRIDAFYDWTWLLAHYLYLGHLDGEPDQRAALAAYLQARDASIHEYLGLSERGLLKTLERYVRRTPPRIQVPLETSDPIAGNFECLSDFHRDHELAMAIVSQNPDMAQSLIEPHLSTHSDDVELLVTRAWIASAREDHSGALALAEQALTLAPEDANAMIAVADFRVYDCLLKLDESCRERWGKSRNQYRAALRLDASRFDAVLGLGLAYLYTGKPGEAVNYLKVAYARAPWAPITNFYLGESYRLIGDSRGEGYLINARNWASEELWQRLARESLRLLREESLIPASEGI